MPLLLLIFILFFLFLQPGFVAEVHVGVLVLGDLVHALLVLQVKAGAASDRLLVEILLVAGEGAGIGDDQALAGVGPVVGLAPADDREARLALELRVLVGLADDDFDGVALARRDAGLVAVAALNELDQASRQLGLQAADPYAAHGVDLDAVPVDAQLGDIPGGELRADVVSGRPECGGCGLAHLLDEEVEVDLDRPALQDVLGVDQALQLGRILPSDRIHGVDRQRSVVRRLRVLQPAQLRQRLAKAVLGALVGPKAADDELVELHRLVPAGVHGEPDGLVNISRLRLRRFLGLSRHSARSSKTVGVLRSWAAPQRPSATVYGLRPRSTRGTTCMGHMCKMPRPFVVWSQHSQLDTGTFAANSFHWSIGGPRRRTLAPGCPGRGRGTGGAERPAFTSNANLSH